ncbi:hypothetical protein [Streptomyces sp. YS415]|uniref:hypothetical protein n=1 Tax=Streptomyces sp. YS415 TaxID=2944806 RepID=UPI00201FD455|nr:hypothetical protein [Streptomyces sp. YS415]MCL7427059.1 hypothetical protein [Streptomyces sp. YS415]
MRHRRCQVPRAAALIADGNGEDRGTYRRILDVGHPVLIVTGTDPGSRKLAELRAVREALYESAADRIALAGLQLEAVAPLWSNPDRAE